MRKALSLVKHGFTNYDLSQQEWNLDGVPFKTLWVPFDSGNRTAAINLNHAMGDFIGCDILIGANGNCGTTYAILPIPTGWTEDEEVTRLADSLQTKPGEISGYRALNASLRLPEIIQGIVRMAGVEWSAAIYGDVAAIDLVTAEEKLHKLRQINIQQVRDRMRSHKATGLLYVTEAQALKLQKTLHRYPEGHSFAGQVIGVTFRPQRLVRSYGRTTITDRVSETPGIEVDTIYYHECGVRLLSGQVNIIVGSVPKAIAELDRAVAEHDARLQEIVEQTFTRGVRVSRAGRSPRTVHSREEIIALLPTWGLEWNAPSQKYMDTFLTTPQVKCNLHLPHSGPVPTVLTRL